jgi:hypothetical protein
MIKIALLLLLHLFAPRLRGKLVAGTNAPSFLVCMALPPLGLLPLLLLPPLPTVMMKFPFRAPPTILLWLHVLVMLRFLSCGQAFLTLTPPLPLLLFTLDLPCRLAAAADALLGLVNTDLLLVLGHG